jgi:prepilin-type N-terminal cleavage/methylation domain-containing protein/prepilin-type processing-associated H-X9-DG protein
MLPKPLIRAFTLIELLVVISIVVLLIALLMPALKKAKHAATRSVCLSRQHQLGIATASYASDHRGHCWTFPGHNDSSWQISIRHGPDLDPSHPQSNINMYGNPGPAWIAHGVLYGMGYTGQVADVMMCPGVTALDWRQWGYPVSGRTPWYWPGGYAPGDTATNPPKFWGPNASTDVGNSTYAPREGNLVDFTRAVDTTPYTRGDGTTFLGAGFGNAYESYKVEGGKTGIAILACFFGENNRLAHEREGVNVLYLDGSARWFKDEPYGSIGGTVLTYNGEYPGLQLATPFAGWQEFRYLLLFKGHFDPMYGSR